MCRHQWMHPRPFQGIGVTVLCSVALLLFRCTTREEPSASTEEQALSQCQFTPTNTAPVPDSPVGGPVIPHVRIHSIYWDQNTRFQAYRDSFYRTIVNSPYLDWLSEYAPVISTTQPSQRGVAIERGSFIDSLVDSGAPAPIPSDVGPQTLTDAQIRQELTRLLQNNRFSVEAPIGTFGQRPGEAFTFTEDLFLIHTPPYFSVDARQAGVGYICPAPGYQPQGSSASAYHGSMFFGNALIWYAVLPDCGCGPSDTRGNCIRSLQTVEDNFTTFASHEIAEAITDPNNNAWSAEIGDRCQAGPPTSINGFAVQMEWSNARRTCIGTACGCGDFTTDSNNCGACGNVCPANSTCVNSQCECQPGFTRCGNQCVDTTSNSGNCGACGRVCAALNYQCINSNCVCPAPYTTCSNGSCVDTQGDPHNCGGCGIVCASGYTCEAGHCIRTRSCANLHCNPPSHCCDDGQGNVACYPAHLLCQ